MTDTKLQLGTCDYPEHVEQDNWEQHARQQKSLGFTYVRLAEFAWTLLEPQDGVWQWDWLDDAIAVYQQQDLQIVLGTPTATPPAWLIARHPEILPMDEQGLRKNFGSRRHYDYASEIYQHYTHRIVSKMAERYGNHPAVVGWQIDNEHGHEGTAQSFGGASAAQFPQWLADKYQTLDNLNQAWGTVFWSQQYSDWEQIRPPNLTAVRQPNPSHILDYRQFCSALVNAFQNEQINIIRSLSPGRFITHNFVIFSQELDIYQLSEKLDFVAWDSYPIGMLEYFATWESEETKTQFARTGHPDLVSVNHDIYRGLKQGKGFWVMEQQCGHANWAQYNPLPADGSVALWTAQAWAHGADGIIYFRWRAAHMAQEIMHSGLLRPDGSEDRGFAEVKQLTTDAFNLAPTQNRVVLLNDYQSCWAYNQQRHHQDLSYWRQFMMFYQCFRQLGVDVDILHPKDLQPAQYDIVVAPALVMLNKNIANTFDSVAKGGKLVLGPRCGFYNETGKVPSEGQYSMIRELVGLKVNNVDSLRPTLSEQIDHSHSGKQFKAELWCESYSPHSANVEYHYASGPLKGQAAVCRLDNVLTVGALSHELLNEVFSNLLHEANIPNWPMPEGVRITRRGSKSLVFNFNQATVSWNGLTLAPVSWQELEH